MEPSLPELPGAEDVVTYLEALLREVINPAAELERVVQRMEEDFRQFVEEEGRLFTAKESAE